MVTAFLILYHFKQETMTCNEERQKICQHFLHYEAKNLESRQNRRRKVTILSNKGELIIEGRYLEQLSS